MGLDLVFGVGAALLRGFDRNSERIPNPMLELGVCSCGFPIVLFFFGTTRKTEPHFSGPDLFLELAPLLLWAIRKDKEETEERHSNNCMWRSRRPSGSTFHRNLFFVGLVLFFLRVSATGSSLSPDPKERTAQ